MWADTTTRHGRLMLTVLGGLAEFERELIRAPTGEGRKLTKARGGKMGPKFARSYNVSHSTISRLTL
jgi:DNA invertase Pin-like site-specific DNA recombinase